MVCPQWPSRGETRLAGHRPEHNKLYRDGHAHRGEPDQSWLQDLPMGKLAMRSVDDMTVFEREAERGCATSYR
eukprot:11144822-Heterocapsa_arctica.AAC.1